MIDRQSGRILAIDWGTKRIGLALSDAERILASPYATLEFSPHICLPRIGEIILEEGVSLIVIGLPINMDGSEGESAKAVREFAASLECLQVPVQLVDERLSSYTAEQRLREGGKKPSRKKALVDRAAAAVILQDYLDQLKRE